MNDNPVIAKLRRIFEVAPWLKDSNNSVHMQIDDPTITNYHKPLPHLSWRELYAMMEDAELLKKSKQVSA